MTLVESLGAFVAGAVSYWGFFHHGEHFLYPFRYMQVFIMTVLAGAIFLSQNLNVGFTVALSAAMRYGGIFLSGIYVNCIIYRAFLNPLNKIPGPFLARITKFDHVVRNRKFDANHQFLKLHEKYGNFLRVGPNDISVIDARGVQATSAPDTKCTKAPWYDHDAPRISMHTTRDRAMHDRRRRIWAPAFSDKALRGYERRVQAFNDLLITKLDETKGNNPVDSLVDVSPY